MDGRVLTNAATKLTPRLGQRACARVNRVLTEQLLDAQELIVLRQTIRAAQRTGLDRFRSGAVHRHGDGANGRVLGFAVWSYLSLLTGPSGCAGTRR